MFLVFVLCGQWSCFLSRFLNYLWCTVYLTSCRASCSQSCHVLGCVLIDILTNWRLHLAKLPQIFGDEDRIQDMEGLLGKIDEFNPDLEEWPQYVERLEYFFEANGIVEADNAKKRRSTFLSVIGPGPHKLLQSL